ncbi:MAG: SDR family oxidoreductase [Sphingopyxis sp.]
MSVIAITGATGFLGQMVVDQAVASGVRVRALARTAPPPRDGVEWIAGALADDDALDRLCAGADAVLHAAGAVNVPSRAAFAAANIAGTQAMVDAAQRAGVRRFVHISSLAARHPMLSNYGWSKAGAEDVVRASPLDWTIIRPPGIYGPRDRDMLELFAMAQRGIMLLPPAGRGSWVHVADLARLLLALCAATAEHFGQIYEADDGTPGGYSHRELGRAITSAMGRRAITLSAPRLLLRLAARADRLVRGDAARLTPDRAAYMAHPDWVVDAALAPPAQLWQPGISLVDGVARTAAWYRDAGWL